MKYNKSICFKLTEQDNENLKSLMIKTDDFNQSKIIRDGLKVYTECLNKAPQILENLNLKDEV